MRLRLLSLLGATLLLGGTSAAAQVTNYPWEATISATRVAAALPLMSAEAGGTLPTLSQLSRVGLTAQQYAIIKDCLIVARLDAAQPTRLQGLTGTALQVRQSNVQLYTQNKAKLDPVLSRLSIIPPVTEDTLLAGKKGEDTLTNVIRR